MSLSLSVLEGHGPLYAPPGDAPAPGIMVVHGGEGPMAGWSHRFAAILAAHGYLALPVSYGEGSFFAAGPIREVPLERLSEALDALAAHPRCSASGAFGWSRGAEALCLLAALSGARPSLGALAVHAPSAVVNEALDPDRLEAFLSARNRDPDAPRAWTWGGRADDPRLSPGAAIEIERYPGPMFLSVGLADEVWDAGQTQKLAARRRAAGVPAQVWAVEGQGHAFDYQTEPQLWARLTTFFESHLRAAA